MGWTAHSLEQGGGGKESEAEDILERSPERARLSNFSRLLTARKKSS